MAAGQACGMTAVFAGHNASAPPLCVKTGKTKIGPGAIVLVVGPSGAGKDTLLGEAARLLRQDAGVVFPKRVITRACDLAHEDHETISYEEFHALQTGGEVAFSWEAHGHGYLVPKAVDGLSRGGKAVVVNASRSVIKDVVTRYENVGVVQVSVPEDILQQRIAQRGRETAEEAAKRLERAKFEMPNDVDFVSIINTGTVEKGAGLLVKAIRAFAEIAR